MTISKFAHEINVTIESSLTATLRNKVLQLLTTEYNINEISKEDYKTITDGAAFIVESSQVNELEDINLSMMLECLNDVTFTF